jgi:hypothetical protein
MVALWVVPKPGFGVCGMAAVAACLGLTVCTGPPGGGRWVKAGADDAATSREIDDCRSQANVAQNREEGINQDISATLGRNWQMSNTTMIHNETSRRQAAGLAGQVFNNCMRAKGFTKAG